MDRLVDMSRDLDWERWNAPALAAMRIVLIIIVAWIAIVVLQRTVRTLLGKDGQASPLPMRVERTPARRREAAA